MYLTFPAGYGILNKESLSHESTRVNVDKVLCTIIVTFPAVSHSYSVTAFKISHENVKCHLIIEANSVSLSGCIYHSPL